ncbi:MAG: YncE family protein, partial [Hyphomicrobiaceae bacterium]
DGRLAAVAAREDMSKPYEGRTVSLIDVASAAAGCTDAEIARIPVGSDDPAEPTRPFAVAFAPDGRHLVASCFRTNTISLVDVDAALAGRTAEVARIRPQLAGGAPARPRGIAIVGPDLAAVTGGAKSGPGSSVVFLIDLRRARVAATVTGVGNESYFLAAFEA